MGLCLTLSIAFGVPLFALHAVDPRRRSVLPLRALVGSSAAAALLLSLLGWMATTAGMADKPLNGVTRDDLMAMLAMPGLGMSWLLRIAALAMLMIGASIAGLRRLLPVIAAVLGGVALGSLAWSGHGAAGEGVVGRLHLTADVAHLLASGAWVGALVALAMLLWRAAREAAAVEVAHRALASFGRTGTIVVIAIVVTGLVNSWVLVGPSRVLDLPAMLWRRLLLAKLVLFTAMLGFAGLNRWVLTPAFAHAPSNASTNMTARLRLSVFSEAGAALLVLALVAWLGTLAPPAFI